MEKASVMRTPSGIEFGMLGEKGPAPAPTLFVFAKEYEPTLASAYHNGIGAILRKHGYISVSLSLPYHPGGGLSSWADAVKRGENIVSEFTQKVSEVLDYLVKEGYTDPEKTAVVGLSRGGFMAMHIAAADPRFKCVMSIAPVTDLRALSEFDGMEDNELASALSLANVADKLAERSVWISIGNNDKRVNSDKAIELTRKVVAEAKAANNPERRFLDIELHVLPWAGHGGGNKNDDINNAMPAQWLLARMGKGAEE